MKDQGKNKNKEAKVAADIDLTLNKDLDKYSAPEFTPDKVKKAELKFSKQVVHN